MLYQLGEHAVSILLVVELAFEGFVIGLKRGQPVVSILLVVELAFEDIAPISIRLSQPCFNPSCSGIGF